MVSNSLILPPQPQSEGGIIGLQHQPERYLILSLKWHHRISHKALRCLRLYFARHWKSVRPRSPSLTSHSGTDLEWGQLLDTTSERKVFLLFQTSGKVSMQSFRGLQSKSLVDLFARTLWEASCEMWDTWSKIC